MHIEEVIEVAAKSTRGRSKSKSRSGMKQGKMKEREGMMGY